MTPTGFSLADLLLGLGASQELEAASGGVDFNVLEVRLSRRLISRKRGRLGCRGLLCDVCGRVWKALLKTMHKGTRHIGKASAIIAAKPRLGGADEDACKRN